MSAQPTGSPAEFSLSAVVRAALRGDEPDPHRIAADLVAMLSLNDVRDALAVTLPAYVRDIMRSQRKVSVAAPARSARWGEAAAFHASGELGLLRWCVCARGVWKYLGDCTAGDVEDIAAQREAEAAANAAKARQFRALCVAMARGKAATVRGLPAPVLSEIFNA